MVSDVCMSQNSLKPLLSSEELVDKLISKGVTFNKEFSEEEAIQYLKQNNNYYKLSSYRKNFSKGTDGKYIDLDFSYLVDLAIVDMLLRHIIMRMALDIEHFEKVKLLNFLVHKGDDGYSTLREYKNWLQNEYNNSDEEHRINGLAKLLNEIDRNGKSIYCRDMLSHIVPGQEMPVWVFTEVITFGSFRSFLEYCAKYYDDKTLINDAYQLKYVKSIRNAAGHNNCILNDLSLRDGTKDLNRKVLTKFRNIMLTDDFVGNHQEPRMIQNDRLKELITIFYVHSKILPSNDMRKHYKNDLLSFADRMNRHLTDYYSNNAYITNAFQIIKKLVSDWY